ncbi:hypothetical protein NliqN6_4152 [Naganishia liquefaciens]|uniref:Transcription factor BYE1 n=1 Tax=Naganishia liquefaciens TaxID=104408 RepID=A0A8H3TVY8_9TREE|nr:hypothetical protein NliqN6_4152 [Naganishia liquefaciens]
MAIEADAAPSRVSGRVRIPSIRAREAAEVASISAAAAASKKQRIATHQSTSTPTTSSFSGLSVALQTGSKILWNSGRSKSGVSGKEKGDETQADNESDEEEDNTLYCLCRRRDNEGRKMVECESCNDWFHQDCVKLTEIVDLIDKWYCSACISTSRDALRIIWKKDIVSQPIDLNNSQAAPSSRGRSINIAKQAALRRRKPYLGEHRFERSAARYSSPSPMGEEVSKTPSPEELASTSASVKAEALPLNIDETHSTLSASPSLSPVLPSYSSPPHVFLREPSYSPNRAAIPLPTQKRKSIHLTEKAPRGTRDSSTERSSTWQDRSRPRIQDPAFHRRPVTQKSSRISDHHISKKRKESLSESVPRSVRRPRPKPRDCESESDADFHHTTSPHRNHSPHKERKKTRLPERYHEAAQIPLQNEYSTPAVASRSTIGKARRRDLDVKRLESAQRKRTQGAAEKDTITGNKEGNSRKRKPHVPAKAPSAPLSKRRPATLKMNRRLIAVQKAAAPVNTAPMTAEEVEIRDRAPALGLAADAVRAHCLGKLEVAFFRVFTAYFRTLRMAQVDGSKFIPPNELPPFADGGSFSSRQSPQGRRYDQSTGADVMQVAPPIRITEPIVLDEDDTPEPVPPSGLNGHDQATQPNGSGLADPVSSSIGISGGPQSSQLSIGDLSTLPTSQRATRESIVRLNIPHDSEIETNATEYAKEVEQALFIKTKEYSRERKVWVAGSHYKQQYHLVISSLDGDLRTDLRNGFATRSISPATIAIMSSSDLASEARLREMAMYEEDTYKSLGVRFDGKRPQQPSIQATQHPSDVLSLSESANSSTIDLDSIVDLDADPHEQSVTTACVDSFLNGEREAGPEAEPEIFTSDTANFPLYAESPGLIAGPALLGHPATSDSTSMRPCPVSMVDKEDPFYCSVQRDRSGSVPAGTRTYPDPMASANGTKTSDHAAMEDASPEQLEASISVMYAEYCVNDEEEEDAIQKQTPLPRVEKEFQRRSVVWRGGLLNPAADPEPLSVHARQAAGPDYSGHPGVWKFLNPKDDITLIGRLPAENSVKYLEQNQLLPNRELIIVSFSASNQDAASRAKFEALFNFHRERNRHGVASPYAKGTALPQGSVKDMYLVPVRPDDSLDFLDLMPNSFLPRVRTQNMLLGVYVIERTCKELFPPEVLMTRISSSPRPVITGADSGSPKRTLTQQR